MSDVHPNANTASGNPGAEKMAGREDSNLRIRDPKSRALPLGHAPTIQLSAHFRGSPCRRGSTTAAQTKILDDSRSDGQVSASPPGQESGLQDAYAILSERACGGHGAGFRPEDAEHRRAAPRHRTPPREPLSRADAQRSMRDGRRNTGTSRSCEVRWEKGAGRGFV